MAENAPISFIVHDRTLNKVDDRLFGQFVERASFGEPGPEHALIPGTRRLQPKVVEMARQMQPRVMRFPGGTDVDFIDWRDMISNVPGRGTERPATIGHRGGEITNNFGYDEFLNFAEEMNSEVLLVVNFRDGLSRKRPLDESAMLAAGLVAYATAPVGAALPEGMPDWPGIREKNGRREPWRVQYIAIGNEAWSITQQCFTMAGVDGIPEQASWFIECLTAYIERIRAVNPDIKFIIDNQLSGDCELVGLILDDRRVRELIDYTTFHMLMPCPAGRAVKDGVEITIDKLSPEELWYAWVAMPGHFDANGQNIAIANVIAWNGYEGYRFTCTEWCWIGWYGRNFDFVVPFDKLHMAGIGVAGFYNGLIRSDKVDIATQSLLVGDGWNIQAIHVDVTAKEEPHFHPSGMVAMMYSRHHGNRRLDVTSQGVPTRPQPYRIGEGGPCDVVADIDLVATANDDSVFVHAVCRSFRDDLDISLDLSAFKLEPQATHHMLSENPDKASEERAIVTESGIAVQDNTVNIVLPARTASIIEFKIQH